MIINDEENKLRLNIEFYFETFDGMIVVGPGWQVTLTSGKEVFTFRSIAGKSLTVSYPGNRIIFEVEDAFSKENTMIFANNFGRVYNNLPSITFPEPSIELLNKYFNNKRWDIDRRKEDKVVLEYKKGLEDLIDGKITKKDFLWIRDSMFHAIVNGVDISQEMQDELRELERVYAKKNY